MEDQRWWQVEQGMSGIDHTDRHVTSLQNPPELAPHLEVRFLQLMARNEVSEYSTQSNLELQRGEIYTKL